jgi:hypothetical protein
MTPRNPFWIRTRAEGCLMLAQECDERANRLWSRLTGQRFWWRREASYWRVQMTDLNGIADEWEARE